MEGIFRQEILEYIYRKWFRVICRRRDSGICRVVFWDMMVEGVVRHVEEGALRDIEELVSGIQERGSGKC